MAMVEKLCLPQSYGRVRFLWIQICLNRIPDSVQKTPSDVRSICKLKQSVSSLWSQPSKKVEPVLLRREWHVLLGHQSRQEAPGFGAIWVQEIFFLHFFRSPANYFRIHDRRPRAWAQHTLITRYNKLEHHIENITKIILTIK